MKSVENEIISRLEDFTEQLESGKPIETTVLRRNSDGVTKEKGELWTVARIKDQLPDVKVQIGNKIHTGRLTGRKNAFATVSVNNYSWEVSWETVQHCLNTNSQILT